MNRDEVLEIAQKFYRTNTIDSGNLYKLIVTYIEEIDKAKYNKLKDYIHAFIGSPLFTLNAAYYIQVVLKYFEIKYNIIKLYNNNKVIMVY